MKSFPLYAVGGLLCDERLWQAQARALADAQVCRLVPAQPTSAHDSVAELARAALAQAPQGRFALAGFSLGGYVVLEMMRQAPERVVGLALLDTGSRADSPEATAARRDMLARLEASAEQGSAQAALDGANRALVARLVHPSRLDDAALLDALAAMARAVGPDGLMRQQRAAIGRIDSRSHLGAIALPTLVLCGRQDLTTPLALSEEMAAAIPDAELVVVEDCGHMSPLEQPDAVTAALRDWLARLPD